MYERLHDRARRVLVLARQHAYRFGHEQLDSAHILLGLLEESATRDGSAGRLLGIELASAAPIVERSQRKTSMVGSSSDALPLSHSARSLMARAQAEAQAGNRDSVTLEHLVLALAQDETSLAARIVEQHGGDLERIRRAARELVAPQDEEPEIDTGSRSFRTPALDAFAHDMVERARQARLDPFVPRAAILDRMFETLLRSRDANALLVGAPGAGKTAVMRGLAYAIAEGSAPTPLLGARLYSIHPLKLISGTRYRGDLEARVKSILHEAKRITNVILFLDDAQALLGEEGASTASLPNLAAYGSILAMLKHPFDLGFVRVVIALDPSSLPRFVAAHPSSQRHLQRVDVEAATIPETREILRALRSQFEAYHDVRVDDEAIDQIVTFATGSPQSRALPGCAVDVLDRVCSRLALTSNKPTEEIARLDADIARLEREEHEHVKARDYLRAAAGREALDALLTRRTELVELRRGRRIVDANAVRSALGPLPTATRS